MNREYHHCYSKKLQRNMELLIFGHAGRAVLFFPTRMARFYDYENWGIVGALQHKINKGELQLFCVDSIDNESFYNQGLHPSDRIIRHIQYEQYIIEEVLPLMRSKNKGSWFEVAGCSMGAFHAMNIGLKYPGLFKKVICMSGRYDLTRSILDFRDLFDGYHNENIYFNMPRQYIANMNDDVLLTAIRKLEIVLAIGETDPFLNSNKEMSGLLWEKSIKNDLYIWNGYAHRPRHWQKMVDLYL